MSVSMPIITGKFLQPEGTAIATINIIPEVGKLMDWGFLKGHHTMTCFNATVGIIPTFIITTKSL